MRMCRKHAEHCRSCRSQVGFVRFDISTSSKIWPTGSMSSNITFHPAFRAGAPSWQRSTKQGSTATKLVKQQSEAKCRSSHDRCEQLQALHSSRMESSRRGVLLGGTASLIWLCGDADAKEKLESMEALKGKDYGKERQRYSDYTRTDSGLQYQDLREGQGQPPRQGASVAIDWDGYTIGYYGRPFQARNKAKGGSFGQGADRELFRFTLGDQTAIPAIEEAVTSMKPGGIRRLIVPVELGYPDNDFNKKGPKPTTFSGQRALDFVLKNQGLIDKTLLIDVELVKVS